MKIVSLFSVVRGYNIPIIVLAQYFRLFIFSPRKKCLRYFIGFQFVSNCICFFPTIASGYIINNFYDSKKDLINRPNKSMLDRLVSQKTKLIVYFTLNFISSFWLFFFLASSFVLSVYIFLIWFYSHHVKKYPIIGNLTASFSCFAIFWDYAVFLFKTSFEEIENTRVTL